MADRRRIVTMSSGGRPVLAVDLEVSSTYQAVQDTFAYVPGQANQQMSREPTRYGGSQAVGETNDNGTVSWQALVRGATPDQVAGNVEALLGQANSAGRGRLLEWRPDGATYSSYFRIAGPATWKPTYQWRVWQGAQSMLVDVSFPVRPLVLWDPMTVADDFVPNSLEDYTFDSATSADVRPLIDHLEPVVGAALSVERRARHTVRGYQTFGGQVTLGFHVGGTLSGFKAGVLLRATATTYVEVYVDDNGTNSRLRVDVVMAGVRANRASVNLASRLTTNSDHVVRGRITAGADGTVSGNLVAAEHFAAASATPTGTPTNSTSYTLVPGTDGGAPDQTSGQTGWSWVPQSSTATLREFQSCPYVRRAIASPSVTRYSDPIPGTAPALMDVTIGMPARVQNRQFGMVAWAPQNAATSNAVAVLDSSAATSHDTLTEGAQAGAYGGSDARTTVAGAITFGTVVGLKWSLVNQDFPADDFGDNSVDLEIWARLVMATSLVNPRAAARISSDGILDQYTIEYGTNGRPLRPPAVVTSYKLSRLGMIPAAAVFASGYLRIDLYCDAGSTGAFGIDYAVLVPARRRASSPTAVAGPPVTGTNTYPTFAPYASEMSRTIRSDLSGLIAAPPAAAGPYSGMGGALLQPPAGPLDVLTAVAFNVPDSSTDEVDLTADPVTTMLDVLPRSYLLRSA